MEINELQIGDLIEYSDTILRYKTKIYGFTEYGDAMIKALNREETIEMLLSYIEPIPITKKFIYDNNLSYKKIVDDIRTCGVILAEYDGVYMLDIFDRAKNRPIYTLHKPIKYIHELQHALRLFGLYELADNLIIE